MDSALETALEADGPLIFWAVEIVGDGLTLRLLDGPGALSIGGNPYVGEDASYGTFSLPADFSDGISGDAPSFSCTLNPPSDSAALTVLDAMKQRSAVSLYVGAINRDTGAVIGTDLRFEGEIDVASLAIDKNRAAIGLDVVSIWDRFFDTEEGLGLTDAAWQSIYAGELAFQYVSAVQRQLPWGSDTIRPAVVTGAVQSPSMTPGGTSPTQTIVGSGFIPGLLGGLIGAQL